MNVQNISIDDIYVSNSDIFLRIGDTISILLISNTTDYEVYIPNMIMALVPFKNLSLMYIDSTTHRKQINAYITRTPVILIFLNKMLYTTIDKSDINANYIVALLQNMYSKFIFRKNFINYGISNVEYKFHE